MNFKEMMAQRLADEGLFDDQIDCIIDLAIKDPGFCPDMDGHWNKKTSDYPLAMSATIQRALWPLAFKWLKRNKPYAHFLCQFDSAYPRETGSEQDEFIRQYQSSQQVAMELEQEAESQ